MADALELEVATPERLLVREEVTEVQLPGKDGYLGAVLRDKVLSIRAKSELAEMSASPRVVGRTEREGQEHEQDRCGGPARHDRCSRSPAWFFMSTPPNPH